MIKRIYGYFMVVLIAIMLLFPHVLPMGTDDLIKVIAIMIAADMAMSKED